tara:strand:- start:1796 stop:3118 length:1323 start_codon:yes stop_codon:yes gene_type:complete
MCSFIGTNKIIIIDNLEEANKFSKNRGPDGTNITTHRGITFVHNLLSITGDFTPQPLISEDETILCVFNGEIYNYKSFGDYKTDGECIIALYQSMGEDCIKQLDGEFAIVLVDFSKDKIIFATDPFATKPLWCSNEGGEFGFASYESSLNCLGFKKSIKVPANTIFSYRLSDLKKVRKDSVYKFDIRQHKNHYEDWSSAFIQSLKKRTLETRESVFIGLSGGYDSGAIAAGLESIDFSYRAYTIPGAENGDTLAKRKQVVTDMQILDITPDQFYFEKDFLKEQCEDFHHDGKPAARTDKASAGLSFICRTARKENYKIYLSGQGADEITSDYGFNGRRIYGHSQFGGKFPEDLSTLFPWRSFYGGTQEKYLGKEECVAGSHGVETRYPFLDKYLVQEFLWLDHKLKNAQYKAPIDFFLKKFDFPYIIEEKVGFRPNHKFK